jgi:hypothetical protein
VDQSTKMKLQSTAKDILSNKIYGKDYQNSKSQSSLQVFVSLTMGVPFTVSEESRKQAAIHFCLSTQLKDFPKDKIPGKSLGSAFLTHNSTPDAFKTEIMKYCYLAVSTTIL